jgi:hypothetical protein
VILSVSWFAFRHTLLLLLLRINSQFKLIKQFGFLQIKSEMAKVGSKQGAALEVSYQVPSSTGGFIPADPIKFCLRYRPPTIAIVYELINTQKGGHRKYVHEIKVDLKETSDLKSVCEDLFIREKTYFNPTKISRNQVIIFILTLIR